MTEELYIAFLKLCAETHPLILHDDETNVRFSKYGEEIVTQIAAGGVLKINDPCLIMYCQEFRDLVTDSGPQTQNGTVYNFEICQYAQPNDFVAQDNAQRVAKTIATELYNEMKAYFFNEIPPFIHGVKISDRIEGNKTAGGKASLYGYRVEFTIFSPVPSGENHTLITVQP